VRQRVGDEVADRAAQVARVALDVHGGRRVELDGTVGLRRDGVAARVRREHGEVHGSALADAGLVEPGEDEQILHETPHPARFLLDAAHDDVEVHVLAVGPEPEQLGVPLDRRQRGAQLVGGVGEEATELGLGGLALVRRRPRGRRAWC
jgi:hypothetical protein